MGEQAIGLNLATTPPAIILMAGLQGSGKTTSSGKLAKLLKEQQKKKVLLVSCDVYRPAAIEQLRLLSQQLSVDFFASDLSQQPVAIAQAALAFAITHYHDDLIVDTASMYQGAKRQNPVQYYLDNNPNTNHFNYFLNEKIHKHQSCFS